MQTINVRNAMASELKQVTKLEELTGLQLQQVGGGAGAQGASSSGQQDLMNNIANALRNMLKR